jgi:hypothetical protein
MADGTPPTRLWHPFAAMGKVDGHELVLVRGVALQISPPPVVTEHELAAIVDAVAIGVREAVATVAV